MADRIVWDDNFSCTISSVILDEYSLTVVVRVANNSDHIDIIWSLICNNTGELLDRGAERLGRYDKMPEQALDMGKEQAEIALEMRRLLCE